jgi:hypothetical protein
MAEVEGVEIVQAQQRQEAQVVAVQVKPLAYQRPLRVVLILAAVVVVDMAVVHHLAQQVDQELSLFRTLHQRNVAQVARLPLTAQAQD